MKLFININRSIIIGSVFFIFSCQKKTEISNNLPKQKIETAISEAETVNALKEDSLLSYLKTAKTLKPNTKNGLPFSKIDYDKIVAYDYKGDEEMYPAVIDKNGKFISIIEKQQFLSQDQADKILSALSKKGSYGEASAACFNPHLGLVFFKDNKKVNQINICLGCNNSISEIDIPAQTHRTFNKGTDDEYSFTGFTSKGKKAVIDLCKELKFYYKSTEDF